MTRFSLAEVAQGVGLFVATLFFIWLAVGRYFPGSFEIPSRQWLIQFAGGNGNCTKPQDIDLRLDLARRAVSWVTGAGVTGTDAAGTVSPAGDIKVEFVQNGMNRILLEGKLKTNFGNGSWQSGRSCSGTWLAIDTRPVNYN